MTARLLLLCLAFLPFRPARAADDWHPAATTSLMTQWGRRVTPENAWQIYPRPQLQRPGWQNLNGLWDFALTAKGAPIPGQFDRKILVPFPVESALSGVGEPVDPQHQIWYHRTLTVQDREPGKRVLLNFEAVDWDATVWVNGKQVGEHRGGYDPFAFDITDALGGKAEADLAVCVWDPTDAGPQPRGKQKLQPGGIWYTAVSGIWMTVWLEQAPAAYIADVRSEALPGLDGVAVTVTAAGSQGANVQVDVLDKAGNSLASGQGTAGEAIPIKIPSPELWSPESPYLYDLRVTMGADSVKSYCGLRKIEVRKDAAGVNRFYLNGKEVFMFGPLDQGWWPDGLYTPPSPEAMRYDLEMTLKMGFNMLRKHVKVEPRTYYRACDELGLLVWQDMPSGTPSPEGKTIFHDESLAHVARLRSHPSIVTWVIFNENWGQDADPHETRTAELTAEFRKLDPDRIICSVTGWDDRGVGDLHDLHHYPAPGMFPPEAGRASTLGEFGGLGYPVQDHLWQKDKSWGYQTFKSTADLFDRYSKLTDALLPLIDKGLAAAVYTQTTDVQVEINGLMTYDRAVVKMPIEKLATLNRGVIARLSRQ